MPAYALIIHKTPSTPSPKYDVIDPHGNVVFSDPKLIVALNWAGKQDWRVVAAGNFGVGAGDEIILEK
ncbi:MAG TPA: hypothetical protein VN923_07835 [Thermoanaerobaculia bacterium]|nr:hypothetical protein [Thermoanaerobaculia bacterium]